MVAIADKEQEYTSEILRELFEQKEALRQSIKTAKQRNAPPGETSILEQQLIATTNQIKALKKPSKTLAFAHSAHFKLRMTGEDAGKPRPDSEANMRKALELLEVRLTYDRFAGREFIQRGEGAPEPLEDHHVLVLRNDIERNFAFAPPKGDFFDLISVVARESSFHPVLDYLDSLPCPVDPDFEGPPEDLTATWLIRFAGAEDNEYVRAVSKLFLVALVRRVRVPGSKFDELLCLESPEGYQKSSMLRALCPAPSLFTDGLVLGMAPREIIEQTQGKWIVEVPEMHTKQADNIVKAMLSKQEDSARAAYGRKQQFVPRAFLPAGTTNAKRYLFSDTGNRRYWPIALTREIDLDGLIAVKDLLWAYANALEATGMSISLPRELWPLAKVEQDKRLVISDDPFVDTLADVLGDIQGRIRKLDIKRILGFDLKEPSFAENKRIYNCMKSLGWESKDRLSFNGDIKNAFVRGDSAQRQRTILVDRRGLSTQWIAMIEPEPKPKSEVQQLTN